ncbi:gluconokinase [Typha latifolia]|uniref:gluconokinase n=1 Tax=Typha latifolia TaxID=4733 RepID=UPI003C2C7E9D
MASSHLPGLAIVIMGVSGAGKSTVAESLANTLGFTFIEADDIHPPENKVKMSKGIPLSDIDRIPWLEALRDAIHEKIIHGDNVTLSCSALQKKYREILRAADSDYKPAVYTNCRVKFVCLEAAVDVIAGRMMRRSMEGKHFMPASLLQSQLDLLQIDDAEGITKVDATMSLEAIVDYIVALVKGRWICMQ